MPDGHRDQIRVTHNYSDETKRFDVVRLELT